MLNFKPFNFGSITIHMPKGTRLITYTRTIFQHTFCALNNAGLKVCHIAYEQDTDLLNLPSKQYYSEDGSPVKHLEPNTDIHFDSAEGPTKAVNYFGINLAIPADCSYVATDGSGEVYAYSTTPMQSKSFDGWDSSYCQPLGAFNTPIANWKDTFVEYAK